jgi:hypothetical protein
MSDDQTLSADTVDTDTDDLQIDQLTMLKQRATVMGISYSNNISLETLKKRIQEKMNGVDAVKPDLEKPVQIVNPLIEQQPAAKTPSLRQYMRDTQMKLVRLRITNLDPKKKDLQGEVITVANEYLGTIKKFVPFGEVTDDGFHVPYCIYRELDSRKFLNIRTVRNRKEGTTKVESNWAKEFSLDVLPQLTREELNRLAAVQAAAGSTAD